LSRKNEGGELRHGQGEFENGPLGYERNGRIPTAASLASSSGQSVKYGSFTLCQSGLQVNEAGSHARSVHWIWMIGATVTDPPLDVTNMINQAM
jgi:hypothetical protein